MAKAAEKIQPSYIPLGGVNELLNQVRPDVLDEAAGVFPFFNESHQRMFGKKIVDAFPGTMVWAIHQALNGFGLYGYYLETNLKLYYHLCSTPPDFRIHFTNLQHA